MRILMLWTATATRIFKCLKNSSPNKNKTFWPNSAQKRLLSRWGVLCLWISPIFVVHKPVQYGKNSILFI